MKNSRKNILDDKDSILCLTKNDEEEDFFEFFDDLKEMKFKLHNPID